MQRDQTIQFDRGTGRSASSDRSETIARFSSANLLAGFLPAFRHLETGEIRLCRMEDGRISSEHMLDGLPEHWVLDRDPKGRPSGLVYAIEPGFLRGLEFWTLADFRHPALDA